MKTKVYLYVEAALLEYNGWRKLGRISLQPSSLKNLLYASKVHTHTHTYKVCDLTGCLRSLRFTRAPEQQVMCRVYYKSFMQKDLLFHMTSQKTSVDSTAD